MISLKGTKIFLLDREQVLIECKNTRNIVSQGGEVRLSSLCMKWDTNYHMCILNHQGSLFFYVSHALVSCYFVAFSILLKALSRFCARWHPRRVRLRLNSVLMDRSQELRLTLPLFFWYTRIFTHSIWKVHVCIVIYHCLIRDSNLSVLKAVVLTSRLKNVEKQPMRTHRLTYEACSSFPTSECSCMHLSHKGRWYLFFMSPPWLWSSGKLF